MTYRLNLTIGHAVADIEDGAEKGVQLAVEHLLTEANKTVPHDEGTLERSGSTVADGLEGAFGWDTPYAVRQHEDLTLHHQGKGQAKWAENTMAAEAETCGDIVATAIRQEART